MNLQEPSEKEIFGLAEQLWNLHMTWGSPGGDYESLTALMMEAVQTSETLVNSYQSTRRYKPEESHLHNYETFRKIWSKKDPLLHSSPDLIYISLPTIQN
jgi:hypothetical protein